MASIAELAGDYRDQGHSEHIVGPDNLSEVFWHPTYELHDVVRLEIRAAGKNRLIVDALAKDGRIVRSGLFEEGKELILDGGVVHLSTKTSGAGGVWPLGPVLAVTWEIRYLGLDHDGNLILVREEGGSSISIAGPLGHSTPRIVHYDRIESPAQEK